MLKPKTFRKSQIYTFYWDIGDDPVTIATILLVFIAITALMNAL